MNEQLDWAQREVIEAKFYTPPREYRAMYQFICIQEKPVIYNVTAASFEAAARLLLTHLSSKSYGMHGTTSEVLAALTIDFDVQALNSFTTVRVP